MQDLADKIEQLKKEIEDTSLQDEAQIENYRIRFLGSKGLVKQLMSEMKHVSSDLKKDFGARLNEFKQFAESKYDDYKSSKSENPKSQNPKSKRKTRTSPDAFLLDFGFCALDLMCAGVAQW